MATIIGTSGSDYLPGTTVADNIYGLAGNDLIDGGAGDDTMAGGCGDDGYYVDSTYDVITEGVDAGTDTVYAYASYTLDANVENLYLYGSAYAAEGNGLNNYIVGNSENNYFSAWGGIDTIAGGYGDDDYYIDSTDSVIIEGVDAGIDSVGTYASYTLDENVENLYLYGGYYGYGNALNNYIAGNAENNELWGGGGNDTMAGGNGDDAYYIDSTYEDVISEGVDAGIDGVYAYDSYSLDENVENLYLDGGYYGYGNALNNYIAGNYENNELWGGGGNDTMAGGYGDDAYYVDSTTYEDVIIEGVDAGIDSVYAYASYFLDENVENLYMYGSAYSGGGNALNNYIAGNSDSNLIWGEGGNDTMAGDYGDDAYYVDSTYDVINEYVDAGTDTVYAYASYSLDENVENLYLDGGYYGDGNALNNYIAGNDDNNDLWGSAGDDTMTGGDGSDVLTGGTGADYFTFYSTSEGSDTITDFSWEEGDKFAVSASGFGGDLITTSGTTPGDLHSSQFVIGAAAADSSERIIYNSSTGAVYFDQDGTGATAQIQIATLSPYLDLISSDFQVTA